MATIPPGLPQLRRPLQRREGAAQCVAPRAARAKRGRGDRCGGEGAADLPGVRVPRMGGWDLLEDSASDETFG